LPHSGVLSIEHGSGVALGSANGGGSTGSMP
jgi:hypothetical protein